MKVVNSNKSKYLFLFIRISFRKLYPTFSIKEVGLQISNYLSYYPQAKSFAFCFILFSKSQIKRFGDLANVPEPLRLSLTCPIFFIPCCATYYCAMFFFIRSLNMEYIRFSFHATSSIIQVPPINKIRTLFPL